MGVSVVTAGTRHSSELGHTEIFRPHLQVPNIALHDIILFHVVDRKHELGLDLQDRPYTFVDVETGQQVKAHPAQVREAYKTAMVERWHRLKLKCGQYRIDPVEADINAGFEPILLEFLTKRVRLY